MLEAFPFVGILDNMALTIALISYDGQLGFGLTGDRDVLPDLHIIAEGIEDAFAELAALLELTAPPAGPLPCPRSPQRRSHPRGAPARKAAAPRKKAAPKT